MRLSDVQNITRFNTHMHMYIGQPSRAGVMAFLHGYQCAAAGECRFTDLLGRHLAGKHRVRQYALGWPDQIARFAEMRAMEWVDAYLLISAEILDALAADDPERKS